MRVLLTGSSGWLGRHLAPLLAASGHEVIGLDVARGEHTALIASVADGTAVERAFLETRPQAVIHAAALHKPDIARHPRQAFLEVNVTGTLNLLECAVAHGCDRFLFTSTTSLMISHAIREGRGGEAAWVDETLQPLLARNIYGVTKLAAERLWRLVHDEHGLPVLVLRTARFFPEDDDTHRGLPGDNMKANELLHRRLTVDDAAEAHLSALERAPAIGFDTFILCAPTPFRREDAGELRRDAAAVLARRHADAAELYAQAGWRLPATIDRVYDAGHAERALGWRARTDFAAVLDALRRGDRSPVAHDAAYVSPMSACARPAGG